jgi:hypothetical protein
MKSAPCVQHEYFSVRLCEVRQQAIMIDRDWSDHLLDNLIDGRFWNWLLACLEFGSGEETIKMRKNSFRRHQIEAKTSSWWSWWRSSSLTLFTAHAVISLFPDQYCTNRLYIRCDRTFIAAEMYSSFFFKKGNEGRPHVCKLPSFFRVVQLF